VFLEHGEPLVFGAQHDKGIRLNGFQPEVVKTINSEYTTNDLIVHDQYAENTTLANFLAGMSDTPDMPHPIGIFRSVRHPCYEDLMTHQIRTAKERTGDGDLEALLNDGETWTVS
jgi:2-oxoglutarate ferredoxin oxidoreductase subunit beta